MNIEYKILEIIELNDGNVYEIIKVRDTIFKSPKGDFEQYVVNRTDEHMEKVNDWIDKYLIPYMTRKDINYKISSYGIKHDCQGALGGEYVSDDEIKYLLAVRGIKGTNKREEYPTNLFYQLSSHYKKQFTKK